MAIYSFYYAPILPNGLRYLRVVAGEGKTVREAEAHHTSGARIVSRRLRLKR